MNEAQIELVINKLKTAQILNDRLQNDQWSRDESWHMHEAIDDLFHDCLTELGD